MSSSNVRGCLRRAYEEIEGICDDPQVAEDHKQGLTGIAEQLRYYVEGDWRDPEVLVHPDPGTLDTIRDHLTEIEAETEGDAATRLGRAREEVLLAISVLEDRRKKQREM